MNSPTSKIAREYRLQQWTDQIRECQGRPAGMSVEQWCLQHHLSVPNYYYRLREVRKACIDQLSSGAISQKVVPVSSELIRVQENSKIALEAGLDVCVNNITIRVTNETSPELLRMVLGVAANVK